MNYQKGEDRRDDHLRGRITDRDVGPKVGFSLRVIKKEKGD